MVVRKETQQTGVIVNQSAQRHVSRGLRALSSILAMVLTMALMLLYAPTPSARAMESTTSAESTDGMLSINSSTAVLTDTSGYHLNATVTNTTGQEIPAGTLTLAMNAFYTFVSRNDIQDWSEGNGRIPTPQSVGQADVPALQPGASANVSIDADAHQESLAAINSWGPKPVLLSYSANGTPLAQSHTFVTRTGAGLHTPSTPALHITVAQPLAANGWTTDSKLLGQLVDEGGISSSKLAKIAMPSKDDDARLSFLLGNYITLTNLTEREAQRIIDLHISPINVSVHTTDPQLHCTMLGNKNAERSLDYIQAFCKAGIVMNGQIVICPGWNDGDQLRRTLRDLTDWEFSSCSLVPVGITKYRKGLAKLRPVDADCAREIIAIAEEFGQENLRRFGTRRFFCADELYLRAGLPLPQEDYYDGYRQLENGVGMLRSLEQDFLSAMRLEDPAAAPSPFTIATGTAAAPFLRGLLEQAKAYFPRLEGQVIAVENDFFGHTIDVAGLLTGQDLSAQLQRVPSLGRVLLPLHMLRHGETVFLDDYTVARLADELGCPVQIVGIDGGDLLDAMLDASSTVS